MREYPNFTADEPAHLVCVPKALIPLLCGQLAELEERAAWATDEDWRQGYTWIVELQANLMATCIDKLIESNNRLYRLWDVALNGAAYTVTGIDPATELPIITPDIPDVPTLTAPQALPNVALRSRIDRLVDLVDNGLNGTTIPNSPTDKASVRDNLEAIRALVEASGASTDEVESLIGQVILALA